MWDRTAVSSPCSEAHSIPGASHLFEITIATLAGTSPASQAATMDFMLEPVPEMRMPSRVSAMGG